MLKKLLLTASAFILAAGAALAVTGSQIGYPIVGGGSYCASFGNAGACNVTIPAGPTIVTGNETIVANTNLPNGQNPQTVLLTLADLGALPYQYIVGTNATTATVAATAGTLLIDPAGTLTTYAVQFPAATALTDNQNLRITSSQTLTSLTLVAGSGTTISNSPTALTISTTGPYGYEFVYNASLAKWFRLQ